MKKFAIGLCGLLIIMSSLVGSAGAKSVNPAVVSTSQDDRLYSHTEAGIQFMLPKGWKSESDGYTITVSTPDDALRMVFWVSPDGNSLDAAIDDLDKELGKILKNIKMTDKGTENTHNGMPHFSVAGTGKVDGDTVEWSVDLLTAKQVVVILTIAAPGVAEKHAKDVSAFISSIKKLK